MATPQEIQELLNKLEKTYRDIGKTNPFKNFDATKFNDVNDAVAILNSGLRDSQRELNELNSDVTELAAGFKSIVEELKNSNEGFNLANKSFNSLSNIAQKFKYDQAGISELSRKELENLKEKALKEKQNLETSRQLLQSRVDQGIASTKDKNALGEINSILQGGDGLFRGLIDKANQRIKQEERIEKLMGLGGAAVEGTKKALDKLGFGALGNALGLDQVQEKMKETAKEIEKSEGYTGGFSDKMKILKSGISEVGSQLTSSLKDPMAVTAFLVNEMISALTAADKATGELAKSMGTSYAEASSMRNELNYVANTTYDINVNTANLQKSMMALNKEFGTATMMSGELLTDYTLLTEVAGYSAEAAAGLARITVATGTDLSENTSEILGQAIAFNAVNGLALNEKEIVEGVSKASKATTLTLGMQPGKIAQAVAQSKALGLELSKVEDIASSLLDFESSISNELEAELLTGKNLNLEKARLAALNGDIATVAEEIAKQTGTAADFTKMNVIQQEALAKSVGMTREDLAKSLIEREALAAAGLKEGTAADAYNKLKKDGLSDDQIAKKLGDEKFAAQLKSQSVQERFNASIEKLREIFISVAEPILQIVSPFMDLVTTILPAINMLLHPFTESLKFIGHYGKEILGIFTAYKGIQLGINIAKGAETAMVARQLVLEEGKMSFSKLNLALENESLGVKIVAWTYGLKDMVIEKSKAGWKAIQIGYEATLNGIKKVGSIISKGELVSSIGKAAMGAISSLSSIPVVGWALGLAAAGGAIALGYKFMKGNDVISQGYGKRTILSPEGAISLNDKDTLIAGTNLEGNNQSTTTPSSTSIDLSPLVERMAAVEGVLQKILAKETNIYLDSTKVGTGFAVASSKVQ